MDRRREWTTQSRIHSRSRWHNQNYGMRVRFHNSHNRPYRRRHGYQQNRPLPTSSSSWAQDYPHQVPSPWEAGEEENGNITPPFLREFYHLAPSYWETGEEENLYAMPSNAELIEEYLGFWLNMEGSDFSDEDVELSYEDLFTLPAHNVCADIPEDTILRQLNMRKHIPSKSNQPSETCIVCQAQYEHEDEIAGLPCGHEYHVDCITQWIHQKNVCPICRATALN